MNDYIENENTGKMILSLEAYGKKTTIELSDEASIEDFIQAFYTLGISASYCNSTVLDGMRDFVNELRFELDDDGENPKEEQ